MNNTFSPQLNTAVNAALLAGKSIMRFYSRLDNLKITSKGFNDYVSEADQESEKIITEILFVLHSQNLNLLVLHHGLLQYSQFGYKSYLINHHYEIFVLVCHA